jgi:hypothetical protein
LNLHKATDACVESERMQFRAASLQLTARLPTAISVTDDPALCTTPHVLTQVSTLPRAGHGSRKPACSGRKKQIIDDEKDEMWRSQQEMLRRRREGKQLEGVSERRTSLKKAVRCHSRVLHSILSSRQRRALACSARPSSSCCAAGAWHTLRRIVLPTVAGRSAADQRGARPRFGTSRS